MKKTFFHRISFFLIPFIFLFSSCKAKTSDFNTKIKIVASIFPIYEWTHNLSFVDNNIPDNTILSLLLKNGVDLHSYQPSVTDISLISKCDVLIYTGGPSDNWITEEIKNNSENKKQIVVNLVEVLQQEGRIISYNNNIDEHIWLSVTNAEICCKAISSALQKVNPDLSENYTKRLNEYILKLNILNKKFETELSEMPKNTIFVCDRFPFTYLCQDYNISYVSAFSDCSSQKEISEESIPSIINALDNLQLKYIFTTEASDKKTAKNILMNSKNHKFDDILVLDSFQSATLRDAFNGKTYIKTMEANLSELKKALK